MNKEEEKKFKLTASDVMKKTDFFSKKVPFMHRMYSTKSVLKLSSIFVAIIILISSAFVVYAVMNPLYYIQGEHSKKLLKSEKKYINTICEIEKEELYKSIKAEKYFMYVYKIESTSGETNYFYRFVSISSEKEVFTILTKHGMQVISDEYYFGICSLNQEDSLVEITVSYQDSIDKYLIDKV